MNKRINLIGLSMLVASVSAILTTQGLKAVDDVSNPNELKRELIPKDKALLVACRNTPGDFPDIHQVHYDTGEKIETINIFSQEYINKTFEGDEIEVIPSKNDQRFTLAVIYKLNIQAESDGWVTFGEIKLDNEVIGNGEDVALDPVINDNSNQDNQSDSTVNTDTQTDNV